MFAYILVCIEGYGGPFCDAFIGTPTSTMSSLTTTTVGMPPLTTTTVSTVIVTMFSTTIPTTAKTTFSTMGSSSSNVVTATITSSLNTSPNTSVSTSLVTSTKSTSLTVTTLDTPALMNTTTASTTITNTNASTTISNILFPIQSTSTPKVTISVTNVALLSTSSTPRATTFPSLEICSPIYNGVCKNGGICLVFNTEIFCECPLGTKGRFCEQ